MSSKNFSLIQTVIILTAITTSVLVLSQLALANEVLIFNPRITDVNVKFEQLDYKEIRAREICEMAKAKGFTKETCPILLAHLYTENGALAEDRHGDNGCSLGMIQWNFCVHENMKAERWLELHPEWRDWQFQVNFYLDQIILRQERYGSLTVAIESWNFGGRPWYIKKVKSNVAWSNEMLN